ncbi:MAG: GerMN domain-containing protein [Lachnospiraceae bacterium]|nr:GerMN domain-containing protein [Lachnospiraceae bacterium]
MKKRIIFLCCLMLLLLAGCSSTEADNENEYMVYYVNKQETRIAGEVRELSGDSDKELLLQMFSALKGEPEDQSYKSAIPEGITLRSYSFSDDSLTLNFSTEYNQMSPTLEVLSRAAIVRTVCQVNGVSYVSFLVEGQALVNVSGMPVGFMTADQFLDNAGNEINTYEKASLTLYFADMTGTCLEAHTVERVYNSNISMDRLVVEELIAGPEEGEEGYPTLSDSVKIISVITRDGTCYVNFDESFLTSQGNATPEVVVYSIVNSLVELPAINKVQISIDGNTNLVYMEVVPLSQVFERNLEIINAQ